MRNVDELVQSCLARIPTRPKKIKKFLLNSFEENELHLLSDFFKGQTDDLLNRIQQGSAMSLSSLNGIVEVQLERYLSGCQFFYWKADGDAIEQAAQYSFLTHCLSEIIEEND